MLRTSLFLLMLFVSTALCAAVQEPGEPAPEQQQPRDAVQEQPTPERQQRADELLEVEGSAACREGLAIIAELQARSDRLAAQTAQFEAIAAGQVPESISAEDIALFGADALDRGAPPADMRCASLRDDYQAAVRELRERSERFTALRAAQWETLPVPVRTGLQRIRESGERVAASAAALETVLTTEQFSAEKDSARAYLDFLHALRGEYLALLHTLSGELDAADVRSWLSRWRDALDVSLGDDLPSGSVGALTSVQRAALDQYRRAVQLDATTLAGAYNLVRGWIWQQHRAAARAAVRDWTARRSLIVDEVRALLNTVYWLYLDTASRDDVLRERVVWWRLVLGVEYFLGLAAFAVLAFVARRVRHISAGLQSVFARRSRGNRRLAQLVRLTAGVPEWLPWLIGWVGVKFLEEQFRLRGLEMFLPLIPFAQLYILYGVLSMAGEWFVTRMVEFSGTFLSDAQQAQAARLSKRAASIVVLPWFLKDIVRLSIGPSMSLSVLDLLTVLALLLALGLLLRPWEKAFIAALQGFLPERFDALCERVFTGRRFVLLSPFAMPFMLLAMLVHFLHKGLVNFDWYRKLMARSFLLRSTLPEDAALPESDAQALAEYRQYFDPSGDVDGLPFIRAAMPEALESHVLAWLEGRREENSLLLSGERSAGKTTLLRRLQETLAAREDAPIVHYLAVPAKTVDAAAVAALVQPVLEVPLEDGPADLVKADADRAPTIIILDNAQNLFLRDVGGLSGWAQLLTLVRARLRNVFWLVSINNQSWGYLANVFGRYTQFSKLVQTKPWTQSEIRSLILSRNQLSGYRIEYDRILLSSRGPEAGNIRNAEQLYFSLLWDACNGNPGIALQLWLSSITAGRGTVTVGLPEEVQASTLERMGDDLYFVYASLVLHENMTSDEVVQTTALPESLVRSALKIAFDAGFVERSENRRYRIVPLWYRTVIRLMARKNLLHE